MSKDQHRRAKELFLTACERPEGKRAGFLAATCGDDAELRAEVEELLGYYEREPVETAPLLDGGLDDLESVAGYRIIRRVAVGGMGEVYEAEQTEPVRRRVALKVIKWGMDTREVLARFESERQALALMDHPGTWRVISRRLPLSSRTRSPYIDGCSHGTIRRLSEISYARRSSPLSEATVKTPWA